MPFGYCAQTGTAMKGGSHQTGKVRSEGQIGTVIIRLGQHRPDRDSLGNLDWSSQTWSQP